MAERQGAAEIKTRRDKIVIVANSVVLGWLDDSGIRRGAAVTDWEAFSDVISVQANDGVLGDVARRALVASRINIPSPWHGARIDTDGYSERLASAFGLTSTRGLYPGMRDVSVDWALDTITLGPTRNRRGGAFGGFPRDMNQGHEDIFVPFSSTDAELGAAIRECLRRCL